MEVLGVEFLLESLFFAEYLFPQGTGLRREVGVGFEVHDVSPFIWRILRAAGPAAPTDLGGYCGRPLFYSLGNFQCRWRLFCRYIRASARVSTVSISSMGDAAVVQPRAMLIPAVWKWASSLFTRALASSG